MDLAIDLTTGDAIFVNGTTPVTTDIAQAVAQRLHIMLKTFAGEWYLNTEHGIPYFQSILGKKVSKAAIDLIFQQKILAEQGVQEILEFTSTLNASRQYVMSFRVRAQGVATDVVTIEVGA